MTRGRRTPKTRETMAKASGGVQVGARTNVRAWLNGIMTNTFVGGYAAGPGPCCPGHPAGPRALPPWPSGCRAGARPRPRPGPDARRSPSPGPARAAGRLPHGGPPGRRGGYTYHETAAIMGTPIRTVMSRLHRARRILRTKLTTASPPPSSLGHARRQKTCTCRTAALQAERGPAVPREGDAAFGSTACSMASLISSSCWLDRGHDRLLGLGVEGDGLAADALPGVAGLGRSGGGDPEAFQQNPVGQQLPDPAGQRLGLTRGDQQAGGAVDHGVEVAADGGRDHRGAAGHGLQAGHAERLVPGHVDDQVGASGAGRAFVLADLAGELDPVRHAEAGRRAGPGRGTPGRGGASAGRSADDDELGAGISAGRGPRSRGRPA